MENPVQDSRQAQSILSDFEINAGIAPSLIALAPLILWTFVFHVTGDLGIRVEGTGNNVMKPEQDKVRRTDSNMIETRRFPTYSWS